MIDLRQYYYGWRMIYGPYQYAPPNQCNLSKLFNTKFNKMSHSKTCTARLLRFIDDYW